MIQSQSTTHTSSISQAAAVAALDGPQDFIADTTPSSRSGATWWCRMLNQARGSTCARPEGAFYVYPSCAGVIGKTHAGRCTTIASDDDFVTYLLEAEGVAVVQGAAFGLSPYFRICYATSTGAARRSLPAHPARLRAPSGNPSAARPLCRPRRRGSPGAGLFA